jgi:hypothetical protein
VSYQLFDLKKNRPVAVFAEGELEQALDLGFKLAAARGAPDDRWHIVCPEWSAPITVATEEYL